MLSPSTLAATLSFICQVSFAQAPIQDRSTAVPALEGARVGANAAREGVARAQARSLDADDRVKRAEEKHKAATAELDAARADQTAAVRALEQARKAEAEANAVLDRALKK